MVFGNSRGVEENRLKRGLKGVKCVGGGHRHSEGGVKKTLENSPLPTFILQSLPNLLFRGSVGDRGEKSKR